ncbi:hypothetical protein BC829DRAFT_391046, partial [Chytridium lagenaria]
MLLPFVCLLFFLLAFLFSLSLSALFCFSKRRLIPILFFIASLLLYNFVFPPFFF